MMRQSARHLEKTRTPEIKQIFYAAFPHRMQHNRMISGIQGNEKNDWLYFVLDRHRDADYVIAG